MRLPSIGLRWALLVAACAVATHAMTIPDQEELVERTRTMFYHAYDSYMQYAFPLDELRPLSCSGTDTWGSYCLTLIDALDALVIFNNGSEFWRAIHIVRDRVSFDRDINVSVFETNIRVLGGLLSAHLLAVDRTHLVEMPPDHYDGFLLNMARDLADRLLRAFDTPTGMPYGTVNLMHGVPPNETPITCAACVGTFAIEFGTLTRLTHDPKYELAAKGAMRAMYARRTRLGLYGNHINVMTGEWTHTDASIGPSVDSLYEYLGKAAYLFRDPEYHTMFGDSYAAAMGSLRTGPWYVSVNMASGHVSLPWFTALSAFWPGLQVLHGDVEAALESLRAYHGVWREYGFVPEVLNLQKNFVPPGQGQYPLRPELIESTMYVFRVTRDPLWLEAGRDYLASLRQTKVKCGYAVVADVRTHELGDRMESFFLAETVKYLYLLFDETHWVHSGNYVFNTEGHIFPADYLYAESGEEGKMREGEGWAAHDDAVDEFMDEVEQLTAERRRYKADVKARSIRDARIMALVQRFDKVKAASSAYGKDAVTQVAQALAANREKAMAEHPRALVDVADELRLVMADPHFAAMLEYVTVRDEKGDGTAAAVARQLRSQWAHGKDEAHVHQDSPAGPDASWSMARKKLRPTAWNGCRRLEYEDSFSAFTGEVADSVDGLQWRPTHSPSNLYVLSRPDVCSSKKVGVWIYRVCFAQYIRQYMHTEAEGNWLGFYDTTEYVRARGFRWSIYNINGPIEGRIVVTSSGRPHVVHYFTHGTHCVESGQPRSSVVNYYCNAVETRIVKIEEPSVCEYVFDIDAPVVCDWIREAVQKNM